MRLLSLILILSCVFKAYSVSDEESIMQEIIRSQEEWVQLPPPPPLSALLHDNEYIGNKLQQNSSKIYFAILANPFAKKQQSDYFLLKEQKDLSSLIDTVAKSGYSWNLKFYYLEQNKLPKAKL